MAPKVHAGSSIFLQLPNTAKCIEKSFEIADNTYNYPEMQAKFSEILTYEHDVS